MQAAHISCETRGNPGIHSIRGECQRRWQPSQPHHYRRRALRHHCTAVQQCVAPRTDHTKPTRQWACQVGAPSKRAVLAFSVLAGSQTDRRLWLFGLGLMLV